MRMEYVITIRMLYNTSPHPFCISNISIQDTFSNNSGRISAANSKIILIFL